MKRRLIIAIMVVTSIALTASIVHAAGVTADWLRVGAQDVGGVTYFNGTIINETTTNSIDNPVTFGDNVRIDGRVWRGATAGTGDTMPFIVNDNMEITGNLIVSGTIVGAELNQVISGSLSTAAELSAAAVAPTTWKGNIYYFDPSDNTTFTKSTEVTVGFTPTNSTSGTLTSSPHWAFDPRCSSLGEVGSSLCTGSFTGTYNIVENTIFVVAVSRNGTDYGTVTGNTSVIELKGNKMTFSNDRTTPTDIVVLKKQ